MQRLRLVTRHLTLPSLQPLVSQRIASMSTIPEKMLAIQIHAQGGLDVLAIHKVPVPLPKDDEILIKVEYAGVNYIDTYMRSGLYKREMPLILGTEPAGTVVKLGKDQEGKDLKIGDQVAAYAGNAFAQYTSVARKSIFKLPNGVDPKMGAASLLQGLTGELSSFVKKSQSEYRMEQVFTDSCHF